MTLGEIIASRTERAPSGCLEWRGARHRQGYGSMRVGGRSLLAHRVAWAEANGPIPAGMHVCHRCDNTACVEPSHLFLGTHADNMKDRDAKGRTKAPPVRRGAECPWSRLSDADVALVRHLAECGARQPSLGRLFGISQTMVSRIKLRKAWAHVADMEVPS